TPSSPRAPAQPNLASIFTDIQREHSLLAGLSTDRHVASTPPTLVIKVRLSVRCARALGATVREPGSSRPTRLRASMSIPAVLVAGADGSIPYGTAAGW